MGSAKVTIEFENQKTIVLELDDYNLNMKQNIKPKEDDKYDLGDKYAVIHGWIKSGTSTCKDKSYSLVTENKEE